MPGHNIAIVRSRLRGRCPSGVAREATGRAVGGAVAPPRVDKHVGGDASGVPAAWYTAEGDLTGVYRPSSKIPGNHQKYTYLWFPEKSV